MSIQQECGKYISLGMTLCETIRQCIEFPLRRGSLESLTCKVGALSLSLGKAPIAPRVLGSDPRVLQMGPQVLAIRPASVSNA